MRFVYTLLSATALYSSRPGDSVDPKRAADVVVPETAPQSRGLDEDLHADVAFEPAVAGCVDVAESRVGDVGVDVEGCGSGGPVARAFLAVNGAPGKRGARQVQLSRAFSRDREGLVPPSKGIPGGGGRVCVSTGRTNVSLSQNE